MPNRDDDLLISVRNVVENYRGRFAETIAVLAEPISKAQIK